MPEKIAISTLNDFIFCPYSIYLHNVYMEADKDIYHSKSQIKGTQAHESIDKKINSSKDIITSLPICSDEYGLYGNLDVYRISTRTLVERKYKLSKIFQGQIYQLWAQYLCLTEMKYIVERIGFYEISTNKMYPINIPNEKDLSDFRNFLNRYRQYNPMSDINVNENKCTHCIYINLCDKTTLNNVY